MEKYNLELTYRENIKLVSLLDTERAETLRQATSYLIEVEALSNKKNLTDKEQYLLKRYEDLYKFFKNDSEVLSSLLSKFK